MTGVPESVRKNFTDLRTFNDATRMNPQQKAERTIAFPNRVYATEKAKQELERYSLRMGQNLVKIKGRRLPPQKIVFGENRLHQVGDDGDWTMAFRNQKLLHAIGLLRWVAIYPEDLERDTRNFIQIMQQVAGNMNFQLADPKMIQIKARPRIEAYIKEIEDFVKKSPQLYLLVCPDQAKDRYDAIK